VDKSGAGSRQWVQSKRKGRGLEDCHEAGMIRECGKLSKDGGKEK